MIASGVVRRALWISIMFEFAERLEISSVLSDVPGGSGHECYDSVLSFFLAFQR